MPFCVHPTETGKILLPPTRNPDASRAGRHNSICCSSHNAGCLLAGGSRFPRRTFPKDTRQLRSSSRGARFLVFVARFQGFSAEHAARSHRRRSDFGHPTPTRERRALGIPPDILPLGHGDDDAPASSPQPSSSRRFARRHRISPPRPGPTQRPFRDPIGASAPSDAPVGRAPRRSRAATGRGCHRGAFRNFGDRRDAVPRTIAGGESCAEDALGLSPGTIAKSSSSPPVRLVDAPTARLPAPASPNPADRRSLAVAGNG
jgi:hypothetical protein